MPGHPLPTVRTPGSLLAALVLAMALGGCGPESVDGPHIILISIDALRQDHLSLHGYERETSPELDRYAEQECVVFDRAYTVAPWTLISHMTMFTGLYPEQHGVVRDHTRLSAEVPTMAERLQERGYHTAALHHEGWIHERFGYERGFDVVMHHDDSELMKEHVHQLMEERPGDDPLFLFLHVWDVHSGDMTSRQSTIYEPPDGFDELWIPNTRKRLAGKVNPVAMYKGKTTPTDAQKRAMVALYDGNIRYVDQVLGELLEEWRDDGLLDNALVMITSDHGEALLQREGHGGHGELFEEALRIPLLVQFPDGQGAGTRRDEFVSLVDLLPTVLTSLELPLDDWLPGFPLQGELPGQRLIMAQRPPHEAAILWPWKLRWSSESLPLHGAAFHLEEDPGELIRIKSRDDRELFEKVMNTLMGTRESMMASWAPPPGQVEQGQGPTQEEIDALRAVGYMDAGDG